MKQTLIQTDYELLYFSTPGQNSNKGLGYKIFESFAKLIFYISFKRIALNTDFRQGFNSYK